MTIGHLARPMTYGTTLRRLRAAVFRENTLSKVVPPPPPPPPPPRRRRPLAMGYHWKRRMLGGLFLLHC